MTGFPPNAEDPAEIKKILNRELNKSVELIRKIYEINPAANITLFFYTPYPGTPLYETCLKQGFRDPQTLEEWGKVDLDNKVVPWISESHKRKVLFLRKLFILKKITSSKYLWQKKDTGLKNYLIKYSGIGSLLNWWVTFRLRHKFYFIPFENFFLSEKLNFENYS